jgi:hypothetical protein
MTIITKGMGAVIKKVAGAFKSRGKPRYKKGVVDRNISSKKMFKIMNKGKD